MTQKELEKYLWGAATQLRGTIDAGDYKQYILDEDTFLKRPVFLIDGAIFIGNTKKTIEAVQAALNE